jgi:hypothetical protein
MIHQILVQVNEHLVGADHVKQKTKYQFVGRTEIAIEKGEADLRPSARSLDLKSSLSVS